MDSLRKSNIELLRIFSMFLVLLTHANFPALGVPSKAEFLIEPLWISIRIYLEGLSLVCVNLFVLISGWCGIHYKIKGVLNLLYIACFYLWGIAIVMIFLNVALGGG